MKIGVIGCGNVGGTLGRAWAQSGHKVYFGFRNPDAPAAAALVREAGPSAVARSVPGAVAAAEVVLLATPWEAAQEALTGAGNLAGKILIDTTNPLLPGLAGLALGTNTSAGELVAQWAPDARVVKAFNTIGFNVMADARFPQGKPVLLYCGDDVGAKAAVARLAMELGFDALDAGPLAQSRLLEPFAMLWISLAIKHGYTREIGFHFMRRQTK